MPKQQAYYLRTKISKEELDQVMQVNKPGTFTIEVWKRGGMKAPRRKGEFTLKALKKEEQPQPNNATTKSSSRKDKKSRSAASTSQPTRRPSTPPARGKGALDQWKIGARVEVYSNSRQEWCPGVVYQMKDAYKVTVQYKVPTGEIQQKTIKKASKSLRLAPQSAKKEKKEDRKAGPSRRPATNAGADVQPAGTPGSREAGNPGAGAGAQPPPQKRQPSIADETIVHSLHRDNTQRFPIQTAQRPAVTAQFDEMPVELDPKDEAEELAQLQAFQVDDDVEVWSTKRNKWVDGQVFQDLGKGYYGIELRTNGKMGQKVKGNAEKMRLKQVQEEEVIGLEPAAQEPEDNDIGVEIPDEVEEPEPEPIDETAFECDQPVLVYSTKHKQWKPATFYGVNETRTKYEVKMRDGRVVEIDEDRIKLDEEELERREAERLAEEGQAEEDRRLEAEEERRRQQEERRREEQAAEDARLANLEEDRRLEDEARRRLEDVADEEARRLEDEAARRREAEDARRAQQEEQRRQKEANDREQEEARRLAEEDRRGREAAEADAEETRRLEEENRRRESAEAQARAAREAEEAAEEEEERRRLEEERRRREAAEAAAARQREADDAAAREKASAEARQREADADAARQVEEAAAETRRQEEEQRRLETAACSLQDEENRRLQQEEDNRRLHEEDNRRLEEEDRRRKLEEARRLEDARRLEEDRRAEEARLAQEAAAEEEARLSTLEEEESRRRQQEENRRREREETRRLEGEEARRLRLEEDGRRRLVAEDEEHRRRLLEEQHFKDEERRQLAAEDEEHRRRLQAEEDERLLRQQEREAEDERRRLEAEDRRRDEDKRRRQLDDQEQDWDDQQQDFDDEIFDVGQYVEVYSAKSDKWIQAIVMDYHDEDAKYVVKLVRNQRTVRIDAHPARIRAVDVPQQQQQQAKYTTLDPADGYDGQSTAVPAEYTEYALEYRQRLVKLYQRHNPQKVDMVDEFLRRYQNQEDTLYRKICGQYKSYGVKIEDPPKGYEEEFSVKARVTCKKGIVVRQKADLSDPNNPRLKKLEDGVDLIIDKRSGNRLHVERPFSGWISEVSKNGVQCVKIMKKL